MRRRDALAGITSVGTLVAGPALLVHGFPSFGAEEPPSADDDSDEFPVEVETIEAGPSEPGTQLVPDDEHVTVLNFFTTYCHYCQSQMSPLVEARERIDDDVRFLSINTQSIGSTLEEEELADWWVEYEGSWDVGYTSTPTLRSEYNVVGYPVTLVINEDGTEHWHDGANVLSADEIVDVVEEVAGRDGT